MTSRSSLAHAVADESPAIGLRDWLAGVRPVAGATAASALLLAVCSWFALDAGGFARSHDVGQPRPVRLQKSHAWSTNSVAYRRPHAVRARGDVGRVAAPRRHDVVNTLRRVPRPTSHPGRPRPNSRTPAPQPTHATSTPASQPSAPRPSTTNLPAPLDEVPNAVTVPSTPVTPGVTVPLPQSPSVPAPLPDATTVASSVGLP